MTASLLAELDEQRAAFHAARRAVESAALAETRLIEGWTLRDLVVHVAYWSEHGLSALELARTGRGGDFGYDQGQTDAMNARATADGRTLGLDAACDREERAFGAFRAAIAELPEGLLDLQLGNGDTVEDVIRYDGPDHYAEHAAHLRNAVVRAGAGLPDGAG